MLSVDFDTSVKVDSLVTNFALDSFAVGDTRDSCKDSWNTGMLHHLNKGVVYDVAFGWAVGSGYFGFSVKVGCHLIVSRNCVVFPVQDFLLCSQIE